MRKKIPFLICFGNQDIGKTKEHAVSKIKVAIITVEFSPCAVNIGFKRSRNNFNISLV